MIRVFQKTMHNREGPAVESRELSRLDLAAIAPLVAVIVALGIYPNFVTSRSERARSRSSAEPTGERQVTEANHEIVPPGTP